MLSRFISYSVAIPNKEEKCAFLASRRVGRYMSQYGERLRIRKPDF